MTTLKVNVIRKPTIKVKVLPNFPSSVTATSPILLSKVGGNYAFSFDLASIQSSFISLFQPQDQDLTALSANSGTGLWSITGSGTGSVRTITGPAAGITVTNGGGVAGNPTLALANDLAAVEGLSSTGIARRTGTDAWSVGTTVTVPEGGTGAATFTTGAPLLGAGTSPLTAIPYTVGTVSLPLVSNSPSAAAFQQIGTGAISGLGSGVATFLATPSSANLAAALTDETGSGSNVFATAPTITAPYIIGRTPTTATVTISNASPTVVTWTAHGLSVNTPVFFATTGALPTGLTAAVPSVGSPISANNYKSNPTLYYVKTVVDANSFNVSATQGGAAINTSSAGSGTHTAFANALAAAGTIGELLWNTVEVGSPVAITSATPATWNSLSLTAGIWEAGGNVGFIGTSGTTIFSTWHSTIGFGLGTALSTSPYDGINAAHISTNDPSAIVFPYTPNQFFLTSTTTINANGQGAFTGGNAGIYGRIYARRVA